MLTRIILGWITALFLCLPVVAQETDERERPRSTFYDTYEQEEWTDRQPAELAYVRGADVLWSKRVWQRIDVRETMNQPLYFPESPTGNFRSLMQVLMDGIMAGEIRAYGVDDDHFRGDPLDPQQLFEVDLTRRETFVVEGEEQTVDIPFDPSDVYIFRVMEEWFIDAQRGQLDVRIIGLSPARFAEDPETGEMTETQDPLFWVPFEEARTTLANAPVHSRRNDAQQISFDDYFIRRFFTATIYREERPDNRVILEYVDDPVERLMEAERIKEEIRNKELDLWHY